MKNIFRYLVVVLCLFTASHPSLAQWVQTNGPYGGSVRSLAISPNGASGTNLFAGTARGIYRSTDNGASWVPTNNGLTNTSIWCLMAEGSMLYAATIRGVSMSKDEGDHWISVGVENHIVTALASIDTIIFAGTVDGVFRSSDGGSTWAEADSGLTSKNVGFLYAKGKNVFESGQEGAFVSTDYGTTWSQLALPQQGYAGAIGSFGNELLVGSHDVVYISTDNGLTWATVDFGELNLGVAAFAIIGTNVFAATNIGVFLSTDSVKTWRPATLSNYYVQTLAVLNGTLFAGTNGGGIFASVDNSALEHGQQWINRDRCKRFDSCGF